MEVNHFKKRYINEKEGFDVKHKSKRQLFHRLGKGLSPASTCELWNVKSGENGIKKGWYPIFQNSLAKQIILKKNPC